MAMYFFIFFYFNYSYQPTRVEMENWIVGLRGGKPVIEELNVI